MLERKEIERPKELDDLVNIFDRTTKLIDDNLQEFRLGIYALGVVGAVLTVRGLRVFTRFKCAKDVPKNYIKKNVTLHGVVRRVDPESKFLLVEHEPWVSLWQPKLRPDSLLPVSLGSVNVGPLGYQWLDLTMKDKKIDFTPLKVGPSKNVECIVKSTEGILNKKCLNTEAVKLGLGRVAHIENQLRRNNIYMKFYRNLLQMEAKALSDHNGIWSSAENYQSNPKLLGRLWNLIRDIMKLTSKLTVNVSKPRVKSAVA